MPSSVSSIGTTVRAASGRFRSGLFSMAIHAALLAGIFGVMHTSYRIAPYRLPGTVQGVKLLTYYSPGTPPHATSPIPLKGVVEKTPSPTLRPSFSPPPEPKETAAPAVEDGPGSSVESGLGEGDIKIALQTYFPYPKIASSSLPHGTNSDVVLNAVIDEHGKISDLKLLKGLGPPLDDVIIATVRQWSFSPATRNGVPIPSEQELHFHYERS